MFREILSLIFGDKRKESRTRIVAALSNVGWSRLTRPEQSAVIYQLSDKEFRQLHIIFED